MQSNSNFTDIFNEFFNSIEFSNYGFFHAILNGFSVSIIEQRRSKKHGIEKALYRLFIHKDSKVVNNFHEPLDKKQLRIALLSVSVDGIAFE